MINSSVKKYLFPGLLCVIALAGIGQSALGVQNWSQTRETLAVHQPAPVAASSAPVTLALYNVVEAAPAAQASAPKLALDISGIIFSDDADLSATIIKQGAEQVIYHVGETLQGYPDARVVSISKDHIKVDYHGVVQDVNLPAPDYVHA